MLQARDVVIVEGIRTPFVKSGAQFKNVHPVLLGQIALKELLFKTGIPVESIDEVIIGNTGNPADAANLSRVIALRSGLPLSVPAFTVHRNCASALESVSCAYERIKSGTMDTILAGGTENMSQLPLLFSKSFQNVFGEVVFSKTIAQKLKALMKFQLKCLKPRFSLLEGLTDPFSGLSMGKTAENLANEFSISRYEQDEFATRSHNRAIEAVNSGRLGDEIVPVYVSPDYKQVVSGDIGPREGQSVEKLSKLKPYFDKKNGSVTVGNSCPITDGAAMLLIMSRERAQSLGLKPLVKIRSYAFAGLEPEKMGLGPVFATPIALKRAGLTLKDIGLIELNEAFSAQVLACKRAFESDQFAQENLNLSQKIGEVDPDKLNVNGGAIALGHPVGATGTRLIVTLAKEMCRRDVQFGLATLCIGGGQGGAMILEREG